MRRPLIFISYSHQDEAEKERLLAQLGVLQRAGLIDLWSEERIAAGEVLGYLGDPRLGEMVTIPAGKFLMGEGREQHKLYLPEYQIGKYPLTNVEYARFIEDRGYFNQRWWTETGWAAKREANWTQPEYWDDVRLNKPNQPVVGVSWYECVAYCRWLSAQADQPYRLPSEAQWEKAARGGDGRRFPWGNEFEAGRVNTAEGDQVVQATTPVGIYPAGASPFGLLDCAGNVWEWCSTRWEKSYPYDIREDEGADAYLAGTNVRVLRGGSWFSLQNDARCAVHIRIQPYYRNVVNGCRVARVSPI